MNDYHVLFLDDEPAWLASSRRQLRQHRPGWTAEFCDSPWEACDRLAQEPFDAIVCDLHMPQIRGDEFLNVLAEKCPHVAQVILSADHARNIDQQRVDRSMQFVSKTDDPAELIAAVERGIAFKRGFSRAGLQRLVSALKEIRELPELQIKIQRPLGQDPFAEITCSGLGVEMRVPLYG